MQLEDYIQVIPDVLDTKFCSEIVKNKKYKYEAASVIGANGKEIKPKMRNCSSSKILGEDDKIIYQVVGSLINKYIEKTKCNIPKRIDDSGYEVLKYKKGGFYLQHTDDLKEIPRRVSMSLLINDEYEGGELQFFGGYKVSGRVGSAIVFPANFCYPHEVLPVLSGARYSIITWVF